MSTEEKDSLELRKLSLEIAELERRWWKRPNYILAALPTLLAIAALSVGFLNGFFSAQLTKLDNQKHDLETQIKEFEGTKTDLISQNEQLHLELVKQQELIKKAQPVLAELKTIEEIARQMQFEEMTSGMGRRYARGRDLEMRLQSVMARLAALTADLQ